MTKEFYLQQVERLRRVYSPTSLNEERVKVLWDRFKAIDALQFEKAVNHLIGEFTTSALPSLSRFAEAILMFGRGRGGSPTHMDELVPAHFCEPCRDFGFDWEGDTIVACKRCVNGKMISPEKLAKEQKNYDRGRKIFARGSSLPIRSAFGALPYNQNVRGELPAFEPKLKTPEDLW